VYIQAQITMLSDTKEDSHSEHINTPRESLLSASHFNVFEMNASLFTSLSSSTNAQPALLSADSLNVFKGDRILLSGASGSGKTLLLEALGGQRPASHKFNEPVVWLTQHPVVTPGSVRENLCLDDSYTDEGA
jgi:ABC-type uncharacterized transport system, permease and ATPase components